MTVGWAMAILVAAAAAAALPILLLWSRPRAGRGWCGRCQSPDLWIVFRASGRSRVWAALLWVLHAVFLVLAFRRFGAATGMESRDWAMAGLLLVVEALLARQSRQARRRIIRCRMCEVEADPRHLRRPRTDLR